MSDRFILQSCNQIQNCVIDNTALICSVKFNFSNKKLHAIAKHPIQLQKYVSPAKTGIEHPPFMQVFVIQECLDQKGHWQTVHQHVGLITLTNYYLIPTLLNPPSNIIIFNRYFYYSSYVYETMYKDFNDYILFFHHVIYAHFKVIMCCYLKGRGPVVVVATAVVFAVKFKVSFVQANL